MVIRRFECPRCMSAFRTESGMKWHLAHKHELPAAMDAIGKNYEVKIEESQTQNDRLKLELEKTKALLQSTQMSLLSQAAAKNKALLDNQHLVNLVTELMINITALSSLVESRFGVKVPDLLSDCVNKFMQKSRGSEVDKPNSN